MGNQSDLLLMCPPENYAVPPPNDEHGYANSFQIQGYNEYKINPKSFRMDAKKQYAGLVRIFNSLNVAMSEINPDEDKPDLVFTADPSLSLVSEGRAVTLISSFSNAERSNETWAHRNYFEQKMANRGLATHTYNAEGTGDSLYDPYRDVYWSGFVENAGRANAANGRSDIRAHNTIQAVTGVPVISMAVKTPFFHIDTAMAVLPKGHIVCFQDGMQPQAFQNILSKGLDAFGLPRDEFLIPVSQEDAEKYACNLRCIGNTIVMPLCSDDLVGRLKKAGYEVVTTEMKQFIYSGGAVHCLTNNINEKRIVGGYAQKMGIK